MYSKEIIDKFIDEISKSHNISSNDLNCLFEEVSKENKCFFKENLFQKNIEELRNICEMCGNIRTGNKKDLIERIQNTENPYTPLYLKGTTSLKDMCRKYKLKLTGNKNVLVLRLLSHININYTNESINSDQNTQEIDQDDDKSVNNYIQNLCFGESKNYNILKKRQLKELCQQKGLDDSGSKLELIERLRNN